MIHQFHSHETDEVTPNPEFHSHETDEVVNHHKLLHCVFVVLSTACQDSMWEEEGPECV